MNTDERWFPVNVVVGWSFNIREFPNSPAGLGSPDLRSSEKPWGYV